MTEDGDIRSGGGVISPTFHQCIADKNGVNCFEKYMLIYPGSVGMRKLKLSNHYGTCSNQRYTGRYHLPAQAKCRSRATFTEMAMSTFDEAGP